MIRQLVYLSHSTHSRGHISDLDILRVAQEENPKRGLSGFLFRSSNHFLQVLEGDPHHLTTLMDNIQRDQRQYGLQILIDRMATEPDFANWNMGYIDYSDAQLSRFQNMFRTWMSSGDNISQPSHKITRYLRDEAEGA